MTLPRELRDRIYNLLISGSNPIDIPPYGRRKSLVLGDGKLSPGLADLSMLRTSSTINAEFQDCIYDCVFCILIEVSDADAYDLDCDLPPKTAQRRIRFLFMELIISPDQSSFLRLPKLHKLNDMINLQFLSMGMNMSISASQSVQGQPSIENFEQSIIVNGVMVQWIGSLPSRPITIRYRARPQIQMPSDLWCAVPHKVLAALHRKYRLMLSSRI